MCNSCSTVSPKLVSEAGDQFLTAAPSLRSKWSPTLTFTLAVEAPMMQLVHFISSVKMQLATCHLLCGMLYLWTLVETENQTIISWNRREISSDLINVYFSHRQRHWLCILHITFIEALGGKSRCPSTVTYPIADVGVSVVICLSGIGHWLCIDHVYLSLGVQQSLTFTFWSKTWSSKLELH